MEVNLFQERDIVNLETSGHRPRIAVMGIGNLLLKDEGIGIHVIHRLSGRVDPAKVELIDGGTIPDLYSLVHPDVEKLIIVDAVDAQDQPGTLYRLQRGDIESRQFLPVSLHDLGLAENLKMLSSLNQKLKSMVVIGVQVGEIDVGLEPSKEVMGKIPRILEIVLEEIEKPFKFSEEKP